MYNVPMVIFQNFKKQFLRTIHTLLNFIFLLSPKSAFDFENYGF
jgi:hypothetical protein